MLKKKRQGTDSSKVPVTVKDVNGHAFTIMINSAQVSSSSPTPEFAGLVTDPLPIAMIDEVEYEGRLVIEEEPITSVNWNEHHTTAVDDTFIIEPLNQSNHPSQIFPSSLTQAPQFTYHLTILTSSTSIPFNLS
jgi:hypothetical protein